MMKRLPAEPPAVTLIMWDHYYSLEASHLVDNDKSLEELVQDTPLEVQMQLCDLVERNEDLEDRNEVVEPAHSMLHIVEGQEDMVRLWKKNVLEVPN